MKSIITIGEILVEIMATEKGDGFLSRSIWSARSRPARRRSSSTRPPSSASRRNGGMCRRTMIRPRQSRSPARDGVDVEGVRIDSRRPPAAPSCATGLTDRASSSSTSSTARGARLRSTPGRTRGRLLRPSPRHGHVAVFRRGSSRQFSRAAAASRPGAAPSRSTRTCVRKCSTCRAFGRLARAFSRCDLFLPSGIELYLFTKATEEKRAVEEILARGVKAVVHKRARRARATSTPRGRLAQPGFAVEEIDPTGAGDCFGATFVSCWLRGMPPAKCLAYAAAAGAGGDAARADGRRLHPSRTRRFHHGSSGKPRHDSDPSLRS